MMSFREEAETRDRVDFELSEKFEVEVGCTMDLCFHLFLQSW